MSVAILVRVVLGTMPMADKCPTPRSTGGQVREALLNRRKTQGGQAIVFVAVALPVLFGMAGLAFDIGFFEFMERNAQTAADAGALAGSINLPYGTAVTGARAGTAANGFTNGSGGVTVTVNNPPASGPHAGGSCSGSSPSLNCNFVEVIVSAPEPTFFLKMLGIGPSTLSARAVATSLQGDCIFALAPSGTGLTLGAGFISVQDIDAPACALIVDSSSGSAIAAGGFFAINIINTLQNSVVGGANCGFSICSWTPPLVTGAPALGDPLAYLPKPAVAACAGTVKTIASGTTTVNPSVGCYSVNITGAATVTFMPGEYSSITISGGIAPTLTFQPGLYVIQGSNAAGYALSLAGWGGTIQGTGVTFYIGPSAGGVSLYGQGGASIFNNINLVAQTTGTYAGILFFQDPSNSNSACVGGCGASITGIFNTMQVQGALYFPNASLSFEGCCQNSAGPYYTAYEITVAKTLTFVWDWFNDDYSSLPGGSPIKRTVLVE
jgi:hypothetical protein